MRRLTIAVIAVLTGLALALAALPASAAAPRVVLVGDAAAKPVEVPISTKQVTLIHFDVGDVSMVAVGDSAMVHVTVKGPDVLLKALAFSGFTNAFIWVAGSYTQWRFVVREANDPRVVIVKDGTTEASNSNDRTNARNGGDKAAAASKPVTVTAAYRPAPGSQQASQATPATPPSAPAQPTAPPATLSPQTPQPKGGSSVLDQFVKTLNAKQLELFSAFLADPTLSKLTALVRVLSPEQQKQLLALLAAPEALDKAAAVPSSSAPAAGQQQATAPPVMAARVNIEVPAGVLVTLTPQVVGGQIFVNYVLQNQGDATLLADGLRLRIFDRNGNRLGYVITRTSHDGYVGRLSPKGVEAGVITIETTEKVVILEWTLVEIGTGFQQVMRAEVQVP